MHRYLIVSTCFFLLGFLAPRARAGGDAEVLYLSQLASSAPDLTGTAAHVAACAGAVAPEPHVALTWSLLQVDGSGGPLVMGLSLSVALDPVKEISISECYRKLMLSIGATPQP